MEEYKGIYYGDETEQKFYEGGAHFKYSRLYRILEKIAKERNAKEKKQELLYVHKANNLKKSNNNNKNIYKKTRNIIDNFDINKLQYNTINNNYNNINYNFQNNYNIFLSIDKERNNNNKNKIGNNLSMSNQKEIDSRNKESFKAFKGRPNTILKESLQKPLYTKKNKILSSSMEQKSNNKIKGPINLKQSMPEFKANITQKINNNNNNSSGKTYKLNCDVNINDNSSNNIYSFNKINMFKNSSIKNETINSNGNNINNVNSFSNINNYKDNAHHNISYSNVNKISMKTERIHPAWEKKKNKQILENYHETKNINKRQENAFNMINCLNSIKISKKTHNIINKRIIGNKNPEKNPKSKTMVLSEILNKSKIEKDRIDLFLNKSHKKKNGKRDANSKNNDININNNINNSVYEKTKLKINAFNSNKKELNKENKILTEKKLINLKKIDKNNTIRVKNNQLSFNRYINKSRNYNGKNASFQVKKSYNNKNSDNLKNNDIFKNYFKTMINMTKEKNLNFVYKSNKKTINNKTSINNKVDETNKKQIEIKPYIQIKTNNGLKNKINLNNSIKVNKKCNNFYLQKLNNLNI